jgi:hypothetical protein
MRFQRLNREDPEKIFIAVKNVSGATITAGYSAVWDISASVDGVRVTKPATATLSLFAGIADDDIADSAFGLLQAYGYKSAAYVINGTTAVAAGNILIPQDALWSLVYNAAGDGKSGFVYAAEAITSVTQTTLSTAANKKVMIRAL